MSMLGAFGSGTWPKPAKLDLRKATDAIVGEYWIAPFGGVYRRVEGGWIGVPCGEKWLDEAGLEIADWVKAKPDEIKMFMHAEGL